MKLVAARCPNCGANIDVDKDSDSTRCEYCKSKIIVEDAIQKVKVDISGSVEVSNSTSASKLMKIAYRHYCDKDYFEALKKYERALEMDPDNALIVLRIGLCKALMAPIKNVDIKNIHKSVKNMSSLVNTDKEEKEFNSYLMETKSVIDLLVFNLKNLINNSQLTYDETNKVIYSLADCADVYGLLLSKVDNNDLFKEQLIKKSNELLDIFLKTYKCLEKNSMGTPYIVIYYVPQDILNKVNDRREFNRKELFKLKPELKEQYERYLEEQRRKKEEADKNLKQLLKYVGIFIGIILALVFIFEIIYIIISAINSL